MLGRLARQLRPLAPRLVVMNASRCPSFLTGEMEATWPGSGCRICFEERPLGAPATLARLAGRMAGGTWMVVNTDMVMTDFEPERLLEAHRTVGADWTVLVGDLPSRGEYSALPVEDDRFGKGMGEPAHYWGVSVMEPCIPMLCRELQLSGGMFSTLATQALRRELELRVFRGTGDWLDLGRMDMLPGNILAGGSFVHPTARVSADARLSGGYHVGAGCVVAAGTTVRDSVMLGGSTLESGTLEGTILPWLCRHGEGGTA